MVVFLRQLATLLAAGIPLARACESLEKSQSHALFRTFIRTIKTDISSGQSFFTSLSRHPQDVDALTCHLIHIGEQTGQLDHMLNIAAELHEKRLALKKRFQQILFYPCLLLALSLLLTIGMLLWVVPSFATLFQNTAISLPWLTRILLGLSNHLPNYLIGFSITGIVCVCLSNWLLPSFKILFFKLPFIKSYRHQLLLAYFSRNFAITFSAGIPIQEAIKLSAHALQDNLLIIHTATIRAHLHAGIPLHIAMSKNTYFPLFMIQMIEVGEESGKLAHMLSKTAQFFEAELEHALTLFQQLLEPLIMIILGVLIGGLVIGMYLPIFQLGSTL